MHTDNEPSVPLQEELVFPLRKPRREEFSKFRRLGILRLLVLIPATLILFGLVAKSTETDFVGFVICLVIGVPLAAVVYLFGTSYSRLAQSAQGLRQMTAEEVLQKSLCSESPFVLYLRNFDQESAEQFSEPQSNILIWANADSAACRLVEEALLRNVAAPVVTLANPKDGSLLLFGAHRFAHIPAGNEWMDLVRKLVKICSAVVVFVSKETKAISAELSTIEEQACQGKAIIVIDHRIGTGGTIGGCKLKREYSRFGHVEFLRTSPISLWEPRLRKALREISGGEEVVRSHFSYRLRLWEDLLARFWLAAVPAFILSGIIFMSLYSPEDANRTSRLWNAFIAVFSIALLPTIAKPLVLKDGVRGCFRRIGYSILFCVGLPSYGVFLIDGYSWAAKPSLICLVSGASLVVGGSFVLPYFSRLKLRTSSKRVTASVVNAEAPNTSAPPDGWGRR